jgi:hypothetical protein
MSDISLLAHTCKALYNEEILRLQKQVMSLKQRLQDYEPPTLQTHWFTTEKEDDDWRCTVYRRVWEALTHHDTPNRLLARYNSTGSVASEWDLEPRVKHIIETDDVLKQSGLQVHHLLTWLTSFELWVDLLRQQGHEFSTYDDLCEAIHTPFERIFQHYFPLEVSTSHEFENSMQ